MDRGHINVHSNHLCTESSQFNSTKNLQPLCYFSNVLCCCCLISPGMVETGAGMSIT